MALMFGEPAQGQFEQGQWELCPSESGTSSLINVMVRLSRWCRHPILLLGSEKPSDLSAKLYHIHPFYYQNKCRSRLFYFGS